MDNNNNSYFYISGFISLSLFLLFSAVFIAFIVSSKDIDNFALKKENYVSISMDMIEMKKSAPKKTLSKETLKDEVKKEIPVKDVSQKETQQQEQQKKDINVDDLFSDVWTKNIKNNKIEKEKTVDKRIIHTIKKKISKSETNEVKSISQDIQKIDTDNLGDKNAKTSTAAEVNEYLAKIQALVYKYFEPPENSQGNSVVAVIELSSVGKVMDFRILTYSDNEALNRECDKIKDRLKNVLFPEHPDNISGIYKIKLISKE